MGMRGLVGLALVTALALSGCSGLDGASPEASCPPRLYIDGAAYEPVEGDLSVVTADGSEPLGAGDPISGAAYGSCDDGGGLTGGGPTQAWRANGLDDTYALTETLCARMEGSEAAADCLPDAYPYMIWKRLP